MVSLRIPARYNGPPTSANGGWTAGLVAQASAELDAPVVTVSLSAPPPLERALTLRAEDASSLTLRDGVLPVATVRPGALDAEPGPGPAVDLDTARWLEQTFAGHRSHPFPTCFVCGPDRSPGDGLRIFPGRLDDDRVAASWTPHSSVAGADGTVGPPGVWASLDCVGGWSSDLVGRPMVLASMTAQRVVGSPPQAGSSYVVVGRHVREEGRKTWTASGLYDEAGQLLAQAQHLWIALRRD